MSDQPPKLPGQRNRSGGGSNGNLATWIALFGMLLGGGLLLGMTAMVMPNVVFVVGLVIGAALFGMLHYVTWGRWLMNRRPPVDDDED